MALHGAKPSRGAGLPRHASHGQSSQSLEERVRSGGRVASQSVEDQKAMFAQMMSNAMMKPGEIYFEKPDGTRATPGEVEAMKNGH